MGECSFWYRPTRVVPDQRPLNGRCCWYQTKVRAGRFVRAVRKENEVALQRAEITMVRWMCGSKLKDRFPNKKVREELGIDDIVLVLHSRTAELAAMVWACAAKRR